MLCFLCGKQIGAVRRLFDQQYCSVEHRKEARLASAQALRDEDELEPWSVAKRKDKKTTIGKTVATAGQTASVAAFLLVGGLLVLALMLPGPGPGSAFPSVSLDPAVKRGLLERFSDSFGEMVRSSAPVTLQHDFSKGLADWSTVAVKGPANIDDPRDWITGRNDLTRPASLRLWDRSTSLENYQMEFQAQIDPKGKSLSWAFRASDAGNYYASKLMISKSGPGPNATLIRYSVVGGHESERPSQVSVPVAIQRGVDYRVRMTVQDDRFITFLNGQVIGNLTDKRNPHGGIGFFDDPSDPQHVSWVSVSEHDSFLGRMLAHFSLLIFPREPSEPY